MYQSVKFKRQLLRSSSLVRASAFSVHVSERIIEQNKKVPVSQFQEQTAEVVKLVQPERVEQPTLSLDCRRSQPQIMEELVELVQIIPQERIFERIDERLVDVPLSQTLEEIVEVESLIPQKRMQDST